jgi:hypothetical protein
VYDLEHLISKSSGMLVLIVSYKFTDVSEVLSALIIRTLKMETLRRSVPDDSHLHTSSRENLKSDFFWFVFVYGQKSY